VERLAVTGSPGLHGSILIPLAWLLHRLLVISVVLGIFNLIPLPPLDGRPHSSPICYRRGHRPGIAAPPVSRIPDPGGDLLVHAAGRVDVQSGHGPVHSLLRM
jgi:hypothetical protein